MMLLTSDDKDSLDEIRFESIILMMLVPLAVVACWMVRFVVGFAWNPECRTMVGREEWPTPTIRGTSKAVFIDERGYYPDPSCTDIQLQLH